MVVKTVCPVPLRLYGLGCVSLSFSDAPGKGMTPPPPHNKTGTAKPPWLGKDGAPAFHSFQTWSQPPGNSRAPALPF